jgi:hypothetical protein
MSVARVADLSLKVMLEKFAARAHDSVLAIPGLPTGLLPEIQTG